MIHPGTTGKMTLTGLLTMALMSGCAMSPATTANNSDELMGQPISVLYQQWGEPNYTSDTAGQERKLYIWDIDGCMNNVSTRADGTIIGYAATGDCHFQLDQ